MGQKLRKATVLLIYTTTKLILSIFSYSDGDNKIKNAYTSRA